MIKEMDKRIRRAMAGIRQGFRAVLGETRSESGVQLSAAEGLAGEQLKDNELFQHYGFTSNPLPGTEGVVIPLGGQTSHGIVIATEHSSYRLKSLAPGEVALYTDEGAKIVLKRGRLIEVECDTFRVNCTEYEVNASGSSAFNTPTLTASNETISKGLITGEGGITVSGGNGATVTGNIHTTGTITADEEITSGSIGLQGHHHDGDSGGTTSAAKA